MNQTETKIVHEKTFETIQSAVNKMVDFIRPTYGPARNKVIISKLPYFMTVDDGVQIARDYELPDPEENAVVKLVKEVAIRTNDRVGDGTTSSLIMTQAIINEAGRRSRRNGYQIEDELKAGAKEAVKQLKAVAKKIKTKEELEKVARVSFDDEKHAGMVAELYNKIGSDGVVTIDKSPTMETTVEMTEGVKIQNGYISPYMVTNADRMETVLERPYILLTDYRITEAADIIPIMEKMAKEKKFELVVIADNVEQSALATAILNKVKGTFFILAITAPSGDNRKIFLEDLAIMTGAHVFSESKGDKLQNAEIKDLGRSERIICKQDETIIVGQKGNATDIQKAITALKTAAENETSEQKKAYLNKRLATFTNKLAVIRVGAPTDNEQKALKYKIEDAVNAVKAAMRGGVVPGGGCALAKVHTSSPILNAALKAPQNQLWANMQMDVQIPEKVGKHDAYNVLTKQWGNMMDVSVVDPVDALVAGIESAVSIASILLTSHGMLVEYQKKTPTQNQ